MLPTIIIANTKKYLTFWARYNRIRSMYITMQDTREGIQKVAKVLWTTVIVFNVLLFASMFLDSGKLFITVLWWLTDPLVDLLRLLLG